MCFSTSKCFTKCANDIGRGPVLCYKDRESSGDTEKVNRGGGRVEGFLLVMEIRKKGVDLPM